MTASNDKVLIIKEETKPIKNVLSMLPQRGFFNTSRVLETDSSRCFKIYIIIFMIGIWAMHTLLSRYTRSKTSTNQVCFYY